MRMITMGLQPCLRMLAVFSRPSDPGTPVTGKDELRAFFRDRPKRTTRHVMSNIWVEILSETEVRAHSYVLLYMPDKVMVGDFIDRLILQDGLWLFSERRGTLAF